jgi:hypothetical protein
MSSEKRLNKLKIIANLVFLGVFCFTDAGFGIDSKEEMKKYLKDFSPILANVQMITRNISQRFVTLDAAVTQMQEHINKLGALKPPKEIAKQHKTLLLAFRKMRIGFLMLTRGNKDMSVVLVKRGAELFKFGVKGIIEVAKEEGLVKENTGSLSGKN